MHDVKEIIFLDFEGYKNKDPSLAGLKTNGDFQQATFDPIFSDPKLPTNRRLRYVPLESFIKDIYKSKKLIAHFTSHEVSLFSQYLKDINLDRFLDLHKLFKQFLKSDKDKYNLYKKMPEWNKKKKFNNPRWTLKTILKFTNFSIKEPYGKGLVTKWMKSVSNGVNSEGDLAKMQKLNLTNLLKHNKTDVEGIEHLFSYINTNST